MRAILSVLILLLSVGASAAQSRPASLEKILEQALAERRYDDFGRSLLEAKTSHEALRAATWMRERILAGDGAFLVRAYAGILWRVSGPPPQGQPIKETAGIMAVYLHGIAILDGIKCADASAASERIGQIATELRPLLEYVAALPRDRREFILETAFRLEERLAPNRVDDDWLCRAGLQAMISAMKRGPETVQQMPAQPGQIGQTFQVQPDRDFTPVFRAQSDWEPQQRARRAEFHAAMRASLLEKP